MSGKDLTEWAKSLVFVDPVPSNVPKLWQALTTASRLTAGRLRVHLSLYVAAGEKTSSAPFSDTESQLFEKFLKKGLPSSLTLDTWERHAGTTRLRSGVEAWHVLVTVK